MTIFAEARTSIDRLLRSMIFELGLIFLILLSVALLFVEISADPTHSWLKQVMLANDALTMIFVAELSIRLLVARSKRRFFRTYWIDIISVMPALRAFRLLRVLRLIRLFRVGILFHRRLKALSTTMAEGVGIQIALLVNVSIVVLTGAVGIHFIEGGSNPEFSDLKKSFWFSLFTLISGGLETGQPKTQAGMAVAAFVAIGGLTMFAVFTGIVSAVMVQRLKTGMRMQDLHVSEMRQHCVICGWNRSAPKILAELRADSKLRNMDIVVVAEFEDFPEDEVAGEIRDSINFFLGDYTRLSVLNEVGIEFASRAILLADATLPRSDQDRDARTVLAALTIEKLNPKILTCAQLLDRSNDVQLQVAGVEQIVVDDEVSGHLLATAVRSPNLVSVFGELLSIQAGNNIFSIDIPELWIGNTIAEASANLLQSSAAMLIAISSKDTAGVETTQVNPPSSQILTDVDQLVVIAREPPSL